MRQLLLGFLMLVMFTPSLACAMPTCTGKEAQAVHKPCAEHHPGHESKKSSGKVNFLVDCMGVDLQKADTANLEQPDLKTDLVIFPFTTEIFSNDLTFADAGSIRGPPPDWPNLFQTYPPVLLTTLRFRE